MRKISSTLRYLKIAPRKVRSVSNLIKGLPVDEAEAQLLVQPRRASGPLLKLLRSSLANAKNIEKESILAWKVESIRVDQGPMLKRYLPRARGIATPIQKKMSHVTLILVEDEMSKPKYTFIRKKKEKLPSEEKDRTKKKVSDKKQIIESKTPAKQDQGFFKKMFSRKTNLSGS